jgi:hypothetical protein
VAEAPTWRALLAELRARDLLDEAGLVAVGARLASSGPPAPWYVIALAGAGAWVAAACFVAALQIAGLLGEKELVWAGWGVALTASGLVVARTRRNVFLRQLALALALTGESLVVIGMGLEVEKFGAAVIAAVSLAVVLYPLYRDAAHRFITVFLTASLALIHACLESSRDGELHALLLVEIVLVAIALAPRRPFEALSPLGHALAFASALTLLAPVALRPVREHVVATWPDAIVVTLAVLALCAWIAGGHAVPRAVRPTLLVAMAAVLALGAVSLVSTPVVLAALGVLVLARAREDRALLVLGALFVPVAIVAFYYDLHVPLSRQAAFVGGSGLVLLAAQWLLARTRWANEGSGP